MQTTAEDYNRTAALLNNIDEKVHATGFTLAYHNHDFEFEMFDGKTGLDILFENRIKLLLDSLYEK